MEFEPLILELYDAIDILSCDYKSKFVFFAPAFEFDRFTTFFVFYWDRDFDLRGVLDLDLGLVTRFLEGDLVGERLDLDRLVLSPRFPMIRFTFLRIELGRFFFLKDLAVLIYVSRVDFVKLD